MLLERLAKKPCARAELEKTIADALDGHLCRCTGYVKYHEAVRDVILADPKRYLLAQDGAMIDASPFVAALTLGLLPRARRSRADARSRRRRASRRSPTPSSARSRISPSSARC